MTTLPLLLGSDSFGLSADTNLAAIQLNLIPSSGNHRPTLARPVTTYPPFLCLAKPYAARILAWHSSSPALFHFTADFCDDISTQYRMCQQCLRLLDSLYGAMVLMLGDIEFQTG